MKRNSVVERTVIAPDRCLMSPLTGCNRIAGQSRGVCDTDYQVAAEMIREGTITDAELVSAGLFRPIKRQSQKRILTAILARRN
jgi:hypothetical protein